MNKARRKTISKSLEELCDALPMLKEVLEDNKKLLGSIPDEEENEERISNLEDRIESIENAISSLEEAISALEQIDL